ncbi:hypothetical protein [Thermodesulfobacterium hydrogeniphilum]|uniref:hypothetical protein n=1 Tax=Thermodesulfobacterium hydrogeniphilum TaxID=161156 RepID=UPI00056FAFFF|nr:hypothetical protein [Thermodesulfobacterium hydrogeniphilum]
MRRPTPKKVEKVRTNVYLARAFKEKAQKVLKEYRPNKTTRQAMEEVIAGKNVEEITLEDLVSEASVKKT